MKAQQAIYLTEKDPKTGKQKAVPEGHPDAKAFLVSEGVEIPDAKLARYDGAAELAGAKKVAKAKAEAKPEPVKEKVKH